MDIFELELDEQPILKQWLLMFNKKRAWRIRNFITFKLKKKVSFASQNNVQYISLVSMSSHWPIFVCGSPIKKAIKYVEMCVRHKFIHSEVNYHHKFFLSDFSSRNWIASSWKYTYMTQILQINALDQYDYLSKKNETKRISVGLSGKFW
jgi:hypothetical protein